MRETRSVKSSPWVRTFTGDLDREASAVLVDMLCSGALVHTGEDHQAFVVSLHDSHRVRAAFTDLCRTYASHSPDLSKREDLYQAIFTEAADAAIPDPNVAADGVCQVLSREAWVVFSPRRLDLERTGLFEVAGDLARAANAVRDIPELAEAVARTTEAFRSALADTSFGSKLTDSVLPLLNAYQCGCRVAARCLHNPLQLDVEPKVKPAPGVRVSVATPSSKAAAVKIEAVSALGTFLGRRSHGRNNRARNLASRGGVSGVSYSKATGVLSGWVRSSRRNPYPVLVRNLHWSSGRVRLPAELSGHCPCPDNNTPWCKHLIAVLYVWAGSNGRPDRLVPGKLLKDQ